MFGWLENVGKTKFVYLFIFGNVTIKEGEIYSFFFLMQEVLKALIDEMSAKPALPRSSKRTRAAEVHNLSEKVVLPPRLLFLMSMLFHISIISSPCDLLLHDN